MAKKVLNLLHIIIYKRTHLHHLLHTHTVDTEPPVILGCPDDITASADPQTSGATVVWFEPTATDNSGSVTMTSRTHEPGSFFMSGRTTVAYTFEDENANVASCVFGVNVLEGSQLNWSL